MAKIITTIEQSKILIKLGLDKNTADMVTVHQEPYETSTEKFDGIHKIVFTPYKTYNNEWRQKHKHTPYFPTWSLAALQNMMPESIVPDNGTHQVYQMSIYNYDGLHCCDYVGELEHDSYIGFSEKEFVDAAFNMICWLLKNKKL